MFDARIHDIICKSHQLLLQSKELQNDGKNKLQAYEVCDIFVSKSDPTRLWQSVVGRVVGLGLANLRSSDSASDLKVTHVRMLFFLVTLKECITEKSKPNERILIIL